MLWIYHVHACQTSISQWHSGQKSRISLRTVKGCECYSGCVRQYFRQLPMLFGTLPSGTRYGNMSGHTCSTCTLRLCRSSQKGPYWMGNWDGCQATEQGGAVWNEIGNAMRTRSAPPRSKMKQVQFNTIYSNSIQFIYMVGHCICETSPKPKRFSRYKLGQQESVAAPQFLQTMITAVCLNQPAILISFNFSNVSTSSYFTSLNTMESAAIRWLPSSWPAVDDTHWVPWALCEPVHICPHPHLHPLQVDFVWT